MDKSKNATNTSKRKRKERSTACHHKKRALCSPSSSPILRLARHQFLLLHLLQPFGEFLPSLLIHRLPLLC